MAKRRMLCLVAAAIPLLGQGCIRAGFAEKPLTSDDSDLSRTLLDSGLDRDLPALEQGGTVDLPADAPLDDASLDDAPLADAPFPDALLPDTLPPDQQADAPPIVPLPAEVGVGECQICARLAGGKVYCWGTNCEGSLGLGIPSNYSTIYPPTATSVTDAVDLGAGDEHNCVVRTSGAAACWGWNIKGAVGNGNTTNQTAPQAVVGLSGVARIAAGRTHSCAVLKTGKVACWGGNYFGQLGYGSVGGSSTTVQLVPGILDAVDVAGSEGDTCVLHKSGKITCFGWHALEWAGGGYGKTTTPTTMPGITDAVAMCVGHDHVCAAHAKTGTVSCWGDNSDGQLGNGTVGCPKAADCVAPGKPAVGLTNVVQLACSYVHTCAVQSSGSVYCFGWLLQKDSTGKLIRKDVPTPTKVPGLTDAVQVSTNPSLDDVDCAVRSNGKIVCWGENSLGQFGSASAADSVTPVPVSGLP